jgi:hypothetical protein
MDSLIPSRALFGDFENWHPVACFKNLRWSPRLLFGAREGNLHNFQKGR